MKKFSRSKSAQMQISIGLTVFVALFLAGCASIPAPTSQIAVSKAAITNANSAGGNEFAPLPLNSAREKMDAAEHAMAKEDYLSARNFAEEAQVDAQLAAITARSTKAQKAVSQLQEDNRVLRQEIDRKTQ